MKKILSFLIIFLAFFLANPVPRAHAATYYVSPSGDDANEGSLSLPWKTIQKAANYLNPGDTVYVRGGVYNSALVVSRSGSSAMPIKILAYSNEKPIIDGTGITGVRDGLVTIDTGVDYVIFNGFTIKNAVKAGLINLGSYNIFATNTIDSTQDSGIWQQDGTDNTYRGNEVTHTALKNGVANGTSVTCSSIATSWPRAVSTSGSSANNIWQDNYVHDNCGEGLMPSSGDLIKGNTFRDNWNAEVYLSAHDVVVDGNFIYETEADYIPIGSNESWRAVAAGLVIGDEGSCNSHDNVVRNNIVVGARYGFSFYPNISCSGLIKTYILNNTFVGSWDYGLRIMNGNHSGSVIENNIIYNQQGKSLIMENPADFTIKNNLWYFSSGNSSGQFVWGNSTYNFPGFNGVSTLVTDNLWVDPLLISPVAINAGSLTKDSYKLQAASPAINKGLNLSSSPFLVSKDFYGTSRPQSSAFDIGAHEYLAPTTPSPSSTIKLGDANGDNVVNGIDYDIWFSHYNQTISGGSSVGDFNGDDKVDGQDYVIWFINYGT